MTFREIMKDFFQKTVLHVGIALALYYVASQLIPKESLNRLAWTFVIIGFPYGVTRMTMWIPISGSFDFFVWTIFLDLILGAFIGIFVLAYQLLIAVFYLFKTMFELIRLSIVTSRAKRIAQPM